MLEENWSNREWRQKFYTTKEWRNLRQYVLDNEPFCRKCMVEGRLIPAEIVDHIVDINDNPDLRLEYENLQSLCTKCHNSKTFSKTLKTNNKANENRKKSKLTIKRLWKI